MVSKAFDSPVQYDICLSSSTHRIANKETNKEMKEMMNKTVSLLW